jgi:hypothetical protein
MPEILSELSLAPAAKHGSHDGLQRWFLFLLRAIGEKKIVTSGSQTFLHKLLEIEPIYAASLSDHYVLPRQPASRTHTSFLLLDEHLRRISAIVMCYL